MWTHVLVMSVVSDQGYCIICRYHLDMLDSKVGNKPVKLQCHMSVQLVSAKACKNNV